MRIYVFRHGIAEDATLGQPDSERRLTPTGIAKLRKVLERARQAGVSPEYILTSSYLRAAETAEIARQVLGLNDSPVETEVLTPARSPIEVWNEVRTYRDTGQLMVVGHNPLLSDFVCFLTATSAYGIGLKKGAIATIDVPAKTARPQGTLIWLLTAKTAGC